MKRTTMMRWMGALLLLGVVAVTGCSDEDGPTEPEPCPGEEIDHEDRSYCILIEEGFLVEDCPDSWPTGRDFDGVIACAEGEEAIPDELEEELRRRGWVEPDDGGCTTSDDCTAPDRSPFCQGDNLIEPAGVGVMCNTQTGMCEEVAIGAPDRTTDCSEQGQVCRDGACTDPEGGDECVVDNDCPQAPGLRNCNGDVAIFNNPIPLCVEGVCEIGGESGTTDCSEQGLTCDGGECVEPGPCQSAEECPQPDNSPYCEGDHAIEPAPVGAICEDGECGLIAAGAPDLVRNCAETGQTCSEGQCVDREDECAVDDDCPQPSPYFDCNGNVAVRILAHGFCNAHNQCEISGSEEYRDCDRNAKICDSGQCTDPGVCQVPEDCPLLDATPWCHGDTAVHPAPRGVMCQDTQCAYSPLGSDQATDCAAQGQTCSEGECVDPGACQTARDCPALDASPYCEGDAAIEPAPQGAMCQDSQCVYSPLGPDRATDCAAQGQACHQGHCVDLGGEQCQLDNDCPIPPGLQDCDGHTVIYNHPEGICLDDGTCGVGGESGTIDCSEQGLTCDGGECVEPGPCQSAEECPQPDNSPYCEGNSAIEPSPVGAVCEESQCGLVSGGAPDVRRDCGQTGQVCEGGQCVDP